MRLRTSHILTWVLLGTVGFMSWAYGQTGQSTSRSSGTKTSTGNPEATQKDLDKVRREIGNLQKEVAEKKRAYQEATAGLEHSEKAISTTTQNLLKLQSEYEDTQKSLEQLKKELAHTEKAIINAQLALSQLARQHQVRRQRTSKGAFFKTAENVNDQQQNVYTTYVMHAYTQHLTSLKKEEAKKARLVKAREGKVQSLDEIRAKEEEEQKNLATQLEERKNAVEQLSKQLSTQEARLAALKKDEGRLGNVLAQIRKRIAAQEAERKRKQEAERKEAERQKELARQRELEAQKAAKEAGQPIPPTTAVKESPKVVEAITDDAYGSVPFSQLKGRLKYPVTGFLMNEFGGVRSDTGSKWKGVFIQAAAGQPVRALAAGRVVFAEWMSGYGNLIIIDHGQGYMSIYGHNESITIPLNTAVKAGDKIATVGNSGGLQNFGLYFELRHQDQPINPVQWMQK